MHLFGYPVGKSPNLWALHGVGQPEMRLFTSLIFLGRQWPATGVNHVALGIQFSQRPEAEVMLELAEEVLPYFPLHLGAAPAVVLWQRYARCLPPSFLQW